MLYASPEAESWFLADWKNGFEYLYCNSGVVDDMEKNVKQFFVYHLKKYIDENVLKEYVNEIEEYGWFHGKYFKLSDEIIKAIQSDIKVYIQELPRTNEKYVRQIVESRKLYYSKKLHGDRMLRNIEPKLVSEKCKKYFGDTYQKLSDF